MTESLLYPAIGVILVVAALTDVLWTTLWVDGSGGYLSSRFTTWAWRPYLAVFRGRHKALSLFGPLVLFGTFVLWLLLLWIGWVLIYAAEPTSLLGAHDKVPADWTDRIYFVAYAMFTMGNGDFAPNGDLWQIVSSLVTGSGMVLVTLSITYLLSVVSAVVQKRSFASQVTSLGRSAEDIALSGWNGQDFRSLNLPLNALSGQLAVISEQYISYPILQYYHAAVHTKSPVVAAVLLNDALAILRFGLPPEIRPDRAVLHSAQGSVQTFIQTLPEAFIESAEDPPPQPDLRRLGDRGIPTVEAAAFHEQMRDQVEARKKLLGLLRNDGWKWKEWTHS